MTSSTNGAASLAPATVARSIVDSGREREESEVQNMNQRHWGPRHRADAGAHRGFNRVKGKAKNDRAIERRAVNGCCERVAERVGCRCAAAAVLLV